MQKLDSFSMPSTMLKMIQCNNAAVAQKKAINLHQAMYNMPGQEATKTTY